MLFILINNNGESKYLISGKEYSIGRKTATILLSGDSSISRLHAVLKTTDEYVIVSDCGSKYGTYVQDKKIEPNTDVIVKDEDTIKFGIFENIYKLKYMKLTSTCSGFNAFQKDVLKKFLSNIGGKLVEKIHLDYDYLTVSEIGLTVKTLNAIIDNKPIVSIMFWKECAKAIKNSSPLPNHEDFKPRIRELIITEVNLSPNPKRKTLFKNCIFVFTSNNLRKQLETIIKKTGGQLQNFEDLNQTDVNEFSNHIFILDESETVMSTEVQNFNDFLKSIGQRPVSVQEVAMAIILCDRSKNCNPKLNPVKEIFKNTAKDIAGSQIVTETQPNQMQTSTQISDMVIPSSCNTEDFLPNSNFTEKNEVSQINTVKNNQILPYSKAVINSSYENNVLSGHSTESKLSLSSNIFKTNQSLTNSTINQTNKRKIEKSNNCENPFKKPKVCWQNFNQDTNKGKRKMEQELPSKENKKKNLAPNPFAIHKQMNENKKIAPIMTKQCVFNDTLKQVSQKFDKNIFVTNTQSNKIVANSVQMQPQIVEPISNNIVIKKNITFLTKSLKDTDNTHVKTEFKEFIDSALIEIANLTIKKSGQDNLISNLKNNNDNASNSLINPKNFKNFHKVKSSVQQSIVRTQMNEE